MTSLIEFVMIFCVLAFRYWYVFIPISVILTILDILES